MARFDVYQYAGHSVNMVIEVQAYLLSNLDACVVIPLVQISQAEAETLPRLKPVIRIQGEDYLLMTTDLAALPRKTLRQSFTQDEHHLC